MRAEGPTMPLSYGLVRLPEMVPPASAVTEPNARSTGAAACQFSGPCKVMATLSPEVQPLPATCTGVFQVNRRGTALLYSVIPPEGLTIDRAADRTAIVTVFE